MLTRLGAVVVPCDDDRITVNLLGMLIQYYRMPLPMLFGYRGEMCEPVACLMKMAVQTTALLAEMKILTDANFWEAQPMIRSEIRKEIASILRPQPVV